MFIIEPVVSPREKLPTVSSQQYIPYLKVSRCVRLTQFVRSPVYILGRGES